jgi:hypothetical protein
MSAPQTPQQPGRPAPPPPQQPQQPAPVQPGQPDPQAPPSSAPTPAAPRQGNDLYQCPKCESLWRGDELGVDSLCPVCEWQIDIKQDQIPLPSEASRQYTADPWAAEVQ